MMAGVVLWFWPAHFRIERWQAMRDLGECTAVLFSLRIAGVEYRSVFE
jgi:hypothetical protein